MNYRSIQLDTIADDVEVYGDPSVDFYGVHVIYTIGEESITVLDEDGAAGFAAEMSEHLAVQSAEVILVA